MTDLDTQPSLWTDAAVRHWQEFADLQLRVARAYTDLGMLQLRGAIAIRDWNGLQTFLRNQQTVSRRFGERLVNDARGVVNLAQRLH